MKLKNVDLSLFSYGLDRNLVDEDTFRALYVANVGALLGFFILLILSAVFVWISPVLVWLNIGSALICLGLFAANIRWHDPKLSARLGNGYFFVFLFVSILVLGGINSPTVAWLFVIPLAAGLVIGPKDAAFWTLACLFAVGMLYVVDLKGIYHGPGVPENFQGVVNFILACIFIVTLGALHITGIQRHTLLEEQLARSIELQKDEADFAKILADTASAANEEIEFERAVNDCLDILCRAQGWAIGHLWLVAENSKLVPTEIWYFEDPDELRATIELVRRDFSTDVLVRRATHTGRAILVSESGENHDQWQEVLGRHLDMVSQLAWPVYSNGRVTAVMEFFSKDFIELDYKTDKLISHIALQLSHVWGRERSREDIENMAYSDLLTGLPNRYAFERDLTLLIEAARRDASQLALMFVDLDGFKRVNDSLGHLAGDELLRVVGKRLNTNTRPGDMATKLPKAADSLVARLGGDEFTVVLQGLHGIEDAELAAQRFLDTIAKPMSIVGTEVSIGASIGIAMFPNDALEPEELLLSADAAMYEAKRTDGSCFKFVTQTLSERVRRERWLESEISAGDVAQKLYLEFQTIVDAKTHTGVGCEALARWQSSEGLIHPVEFIGVAERTGLIHELGQEIIEHAFQAAVRLNSNPDTRKRNLPFVIHVNVSPQQFRDITFAEKVRISLRENRCRAEWVVFEITESSRIADDAQCRNMLRELGEIGVKFVLDDFGTGYASLVYLRQFPFSSIKIDQSFVAGLLKNAEDKAIVQATISMAHALNLPVTAEGVESPKQAEMLAELGCDFLQGNYFGRPVAVENETLL